MMLPSTFWEELKKIEQGEAAPARAVPAVPKKEKPKKKREVKPSCVYFVRNLSNGLIKIGRTTCISKRIKTLQTAVGDGKLIVENVVSTSQIRAKTLEKNLHVLFADLRKGGEWFDIGHRSIEVLVRLLRMSY